MIEAGTEKMNLLHILENNKKRFAEKTKSLMASVKKLASMKSVSFDSLPKGTPKRGVYLFCESGKPLYVGRSNDIRGRLRGHCRENADCNTASFAFRLACKEFGCGKNIKRAELMQQKEFREKFEQAKERIRKMEIRFVEENDPTTQAILEIYCAELLGAEHNDFDTH